MAKEIGIGVLGFGFMGKVHTFGYRTLPYYYPDIPLQPRLVGVCTSRPETAEAACRSFGFAYGTTEEQRVIQDPEVDIIHICTPNLLHEEALVAALAAGKHVYCEKPLVNTPQEAEAVRAALEGYQGVHQLVLHNRFFPATMRARQLVEEGNLGELIGFRAAYLHSGSVNPDKPIGWKQEAEMGGGVIQDLGPHLLDLVQWLTGPMTQLCCTTQVLYPERPSRQDPSRRVAVQAEDAAYMLLRNPAGVTGTVEVTKISTGAQDELRLEVFGTDGALQFNLTDPNWLDFYDNRLPEGELGGERGFKRLECVQRYPAPAGGFPTPKASVGWVRAHVACLANFLQAVAEERLAQPDLRVGIRQAYETAAAQQSACQGRWVEIAQEAKVYST